jgi:hypothetical protein
MRVNEITFTVASSGPAQLQRGHASTTLILRFCGLPVDQCDFNDSSTRDRHAMGGKESCPKLPGLTGLTEAPVIYDPRRMRQGGNPMPTRRSLVNGCSPFSS